MASPEQERPSVEKGQNTEKLKASKAEVKRASKAERELAEADLTKRGVEAEAAISKAEKEQTKEKKTVMTKERGSAEKEKPAAAKAAPRVRPKPKTKTERDQVFNTEMKQVQAQMRPSARTFSKVIHNKTVERVSDAAQKSIFRPSALIGGAVLGLLLGLVVYIVALLNHYIISSYEILLLFVVGALVGVVVELVTKRIRG